MKKSLIMLTILALLFSNEAFAVQFEKVEVELAYGETVHTVVKGDSLIAIGELYMVSYKEIMKRNFLSSDRIFICQDLIIPVPKMEWTVAGREPYGQRPLSEALKRFNLPDKVKAQFAALVEKGESQEFYIEKGQYLNEMMFGDYKCRKNVYVEFPDGRKEPADMYMCKYQGEYYFLLCPHICTNWSWWKKVVEPEKPVKVTLKTTGIEPVDQGQEMRVPDAAQCQETFKWKRNNIVDAWAYHGIYNRPQGNADGDFSGVGARFMVGVVSFSGLGPAFQYTKAEFGPNLMYARGHGNSDGYISDYDRYMGGLSLRFWDDLYGLEWVTDVSIGQMNQEGRIGGYREEQKTNLTYYNVWGAYKTGRNLFSEFSLGASLNCPYREVKKKTVNGVMVETDPWDMQTLEGFVGTKIYTWEISRSWDVTPTMKAGVGHNWGSQRDYFRGGPGLNFRVKDRDLFQVQVMNVKKIEGLSGWERQPFIITVDLDEAFCLINDNWLHW